MENVPVDNGMLHADVPKGLEAMDLAELQAHFGVAYDCPWGVKDGGLRFIVLWRDSNAVLTKLASEKALAKRVEKSFAKNTLVSSYANEGFYAREVAGRPAQGFHCRYTVGTASQECDVLVFKNKERCCTVYYYTDADYAQKNKPTFEALLDSFGL